MGFVKPRTLPQGGRSFAGGVQRTSRATGRTSKVVTGMWDSWYPNKEIALWWAICPDQQWTFEQWDRDSGEVELIEGEFYLGYVNHRVVQGKKIIGNFNCSASAHRDKPCWGCAVRNAFYDRKRKVKEDTGVEPQGEPPISGMAQYAISGVLLETVAKVKLMENGKPRLNKQGQPIMRELPVRTLDPLEAKRLKKEGATTFGSSRHYSLGIRHLKTLASFDLDMRNHCKNCASLLTVSEWACPECATTQTLLDEDDQPRSGGTLTEARKGRFSCTACGYTGYGSNEHEGTDPEKAPFEPIVACQCGEPEQGALLDFALCLISEKVDETSNILKYTGVRPLSFYLKNTDKYPGVAEKLATPLNLKEIFEPTPLGLQRFKVPEGLRQGLSPEPRKRTDASDEPHADGYPLAGGASHDDDVDDDDD